VLQCSRHTPQTRFGLDHELIEKTRLAWPEVCRPVPGVRCATPGRLGYGEIGRWPIKHGSPYFPPGSRSLGSGAVQPAA
jgi:hypothetical protein